MPKYDDDEVDNKYIKRERDETDEESRRGEIKRHRHERDRRSCDRDSRHDIRDRSPINNRRRYDKDGERRHLNEGRLSDRDVRSRGGKHADQESSHFCEDQTKSDHRRNSNFKGQKDRGRHVLVWGKPDEESDVKKDKQLLDKDGKPIEKEKPNFEKSGKLTEHTNTYNGVVIKYNEPKDARVPKKKHWRLYPYKGTEALKILHLHRQSAYLFGRDRRVADIPLDHPSISQQHAVLQYRSVPYVRSDGVNTRVIRPYIIDLESSNGTFLNNEKIAPRRFVELREADMLKFGFSSREYMVMKDDTTEAVLNKLQMSEEESPDE